MALCPECGVELDASVQFCPLCGAAVQPEAHSSSRESMFDPEDRENFTEDERRTIAWEVLSVSTGIAAVVVCAVNLFVDRRLTWSLYPIVSLVFIWVLFTMPLRLGKRPLLAALGAAVALPGFLLALNLIEGRLSWAPVIALPIALVAELSAAVVAFATSRAKRKGANVIGFCLLAVALLCMDIEATISLYFFGRLVLQWSAIVATALVPVSGFLFYLHHRVTKKSNLRKLFRL
ncbi:MAG TPA: DUF6320 domain-containing protein [Rectinemataceae bacterium]|nr:DUF6320 domain-containing protein [Rectinemataceae bacterium]